MIVYKITNKINAKEYIGQTIQELTERWRQHCSKSGCKALKAAIDKYGTENFEIKVISRCNSVEEMNHREAYYIKLFNTLAPNGYNLKTGGRYSTYSSESKAKMSKSHKGNPGYWLGNKHSEETKNKISMNKMGANNPNFGKPKSEEIKSKISNSQSNKISIICDQTGVAYPSLGWAAKELGLCEQNIRKVLKGERKHTKNFTFSYINKDIANA